MEVKIGERVDLSAESVGNLTNFKWTVTKDKAVISTQTNRTFSYIFPSQGEYVVNLVSSEGSVIRTTSITVLAGDRFERHLPTQSLSFSVGDSIYDESGTLIGILGRNNVVVSSDGKVIGDFDESTGLVYDKNGELIGKAAPNGTTGTVSNGSITLKLETLPVVDQDDRITLAGGGMVRFYLGRSAGDIIEYRIDKNIFEDSDGNGVANDDIDNAADQSYLTGSAWTTDYTKGETAKTVAEVTLVSKQGVKAVKQIEILFSERISEGNPVAVLDTLPLPAEDGMIHLWEDPHTVSFYARPSAGAILEYRIDKNIFEDSDRDGDPKNDIDNLNDPSFKSGDVFTVEYVKTDQQIIAQLIVVGEGGKGSRVQKGFVFGKKPQEGGTLTDAVSAGIHLTADKDFALIGDPVLLTVEGLSQAIDQYTFDWDLNGDGVSDKVVSGDNSIQQIYDAVGVFQVKVVISDQQGNSAERFLEIISRDVEATKADFSFEINEATVQFTNLSTVAPNLSNDQLVYHWSFGDTDPQGYEKQLDQIALENPVYIYSNAGTYLVTLDVTDADQVTDSITHEVEIDIATPNPDDSGPLVIGGGAEEKQPSFILKFLKIMLYLILIVLFLVLLIIGGFLIFLKIQHPDLTFEELVDELKVKILVLIGAHEPVEFTPQHEAQSETNEPSSAPSDDVTASSVDESVHPEPDQPPVVEQGPVPEWLKGTDVIEGETEEVPSNDADETPESDTETESPLDEAFPDDFGSDNGTDEEGADVSEDESYEENPEDAFSDISEQLSDDSESEEGSDNTDDESEGAENAETSLDDDSLIQEDTEPPLDDDSDSEEDAEMTDDDSEATDDSEASSDDDSSVQEDAESENPSDDTLQDEEVFDDSYEDSADDSENANIESQDEEGVALEGETEEVETEPLPENGDVAVTAPKKKRHRPRRRKKKPEQPSSEGQAETVSSESPAESVEPSINTEPQSEPQQAQDGAAKKKRRRRPRHRKKRPDMPSQDAQGGQGQPAPPTEGAQ